MVRLKEVFKSKMEGTDVRAHLPAHVLPQSVQFSLLNIYFLLLFDSRTNLSFTPDALIIVCLP